MRSEALIDEQARVAEISKADGVVEEAAATTSSVAAGDGRQNADGVEFESESESREALDEVAAASRHEEAPISSRVSSGARARDELV